MARLYALLLVLCLGANACNVRQVDNSLPTPDENNIIYVTATPLPAIAQVAPTDIPADTPTVPPPTPTIEPGRLMQSADDFVRNGYLEEAAEEYESLLEFGDALPSADRAQAALRLGQASLRAGYFQRALNALSLFINEFPGHGQIAQAYFLRGDAHLGVLQWAAAISDLQRYLSLRPGLIDSYVYERIADAQIALGHIDAALQNYQRAINAKRSLVPLLILREKLAQIYLGLERHTDAVAQYDAILAVARNTPYRASISFTAANAALAGGALAAGVERMRAVVDNYAGTATVWKALDVLSQHGVAYDGLQRGRAAYIAGDYQAAIAAFNQFTTSHEIAAIPADLFLSLGRAYRQIGNSDAATIAFQTVIDLFPSDPLFGDALLERGRTRFLAGDSPAAIQIYLNVADTYPLLERTAGEALWRAGYLYGTAGETSLSRQIFMRLADKYPLHELTTSGLFIAASAAVNDQEWTVAENLYARIASLAKGEDQAAAYLWMGRIAQKLGDDKRAHEAFDLAVGAAPDSYFAARSADFRLGILPFQPPAAWHYEFDVVSARSEADKWLGETFAIEEPGELWPLSEALTSDPRMIRGRELLAVGAFAEAASEFEDLLDEARDNGDVLSSYRLAIALRELGMYRESIIAAADVIIASGQGTLNVPSLLARMRFPAYYIDVIQPAAAARGIDPSLMLALIRQESLFNTFATAAAGEKGLMQVIPPTAQYIAEQLNWPNYQHSDLFRPYAGIAFGAYYIDEQLELFDQNVIAALAAYNAGPGRAYDWNLLSGGDPDLFMTTITIDSTRHYVRFIYRNYNLYRALYGVDAP